MLYWAGCWHHWWALPLVLESGMSEMARVYLSPTLEFFRPLPASTLFPIAIAVFGLTEGMLSQRDCVRCVLANAASNRKRRRGC